MHQITFPLLNLKLNISPIAFKIFGLEVYWYAIIIVSAIIIALLLCKKKDGLYKIKFETILDVSIYLIPISIISARIYYILFNLEFYIQNPGEILNIRSGGIAIYGGIIGGLITLAVYTKIKKISLVDLMDYIVPSLSLAQSIGRWGNFVNVEAFGPETNFPWRMGIVENGLYKEVHPTFFYESICTFIIFIILTKLQKTRKFRGEILSYYLIFYGIARAIIEYFRTDSLFLRSNQNLDVSFDIVCSYRCIHYNMQGRIYSPAFKKLTK